MTMLSVISTSRHSGAMPLAESASRTESSSAFWRNCAAERFTATRKTGSERSCQVRHWRHASRSTQPPSGTMSPVSSASGMKSPGATMPRWGCCQRKSASAPQRAPQLALELEALGHALVAIPGRDLDVVATGPLGAIHGGIGTGDERLSLLAVLGKDADAHAWRNEDLAIQDTERPVERFDQ